MFYEGDLQSGIRKAVQESKLVVCFVTDDGEESQLWENEYLDDENIKSRLVDHAILLRLKAGSEEAGYLAAIYPLPKTPTIVVIRNGELKEYLVSGVDKAKFIKNLFVALGGIPSQLSPSSQPSSSTSSDPTSSEPAQPPAAVSDLLAERRARLDVHKKEQEAREKAKKEAEARKRREAQEAAAAADPKASADAKYALMQKKRQQEAREERARILKRVEDDKAERREREAERKRLAAVKTREEEQSSQSSAMQSESKRSPSECALQVRLFDGSTVRSRFPAHGSLRKDVRPWIDEKQEGDTPYTFKHVLTPLPNKNIETSDEERSLHSLGLTPNATLILVPVASFTSAYQPAGLVSRGVSTGYGFVSSGFGMVSGLLGSVLGSGTPVAAASDNSADDGRAGSSNASRPSNHNTANLQTLREQNDRRDPNQFYNGNSTNFEPRRDNDDGKKQD